MNECVLADRHRFLSNPTMQQQQPQQQEQHHQTAEQEVRAWSSTVQRVTGWSNLLKNVKVQTVDCDKGTVVCELLISDGACERPRRRRRVCACSDTMRCAIDVCNPLGNLHGGCSATLIDEISTLALQALDKARRQGVSVSLTTDYLAAAPHGATVLIEGRCHKVGRTLAFTSAEIRDKHSGRVYVRGSHVKFVGVARL